MNSRRGNGEQYKWLMAHLNHDGAECLIWPFRRNPGHGRGQLGFNGRLHYAHRLMCERVNGSPPTPRHHAAHTCGNGHLGCVHPKHLVWKTPEANHADRYVHNRIPGVKRRFRLTEAQVAEIRLLQGTETIAALSQRFGMSEATIWEIQQGRTWKDGKRAKMGFAVRPYRRGRPKPTEASL